MKLRRIGGALLLLMALAPTCVAAEGGALYKPVIPPGSGMARVFNAGASLPAGAVRFGDKGLAPLAGGELSVYQPIPAGSREISCGGKTRRVDVHDATFQTFVCGGTHDGSLLVDPVPVHINKTFIILYNLGDAGAVRLLANGRIPVIDRTAAGAIGSREINPVRVALSIHDDDQERLALGDVPLAPEKVYSLFVLQDAGETRAYLRESRLAGEF